MFNILSHLARCAGLELSRQMQNNSHAASADRCAACGNPTSGMVTSCCKTPLCSGCLHDWKADPNPCPCRR